MDVFCRFGAWSLRFAWSGGCGLDGGLEVEPVRTFVRPELWVQGRERTLVGCRSRAARAVQEAIREGGRIAVVL